MSNQLSHYIHSLDVAKLPRKPSLPEVYSLISPCVIIDSSGQTVTVVDKEVANQLGAGLIGVPKALPQLPYSDLHLIVVGWWGTHKILASVRSCAKSYLILSAFRNSRLVTAIVQGRV